MIESRRLVICLSGSLFACMGLVFESALAQETQSSVLEEVIVTAQKHQSSLQDTALSVSVFDGDYLDRNNVREFSEFVASIPNVRLPEALNAGGLGIRGISSQGRASSVGVEQPVGVYLDEVFVGAPYLDNLLLDIERIEVLRGPQGTLWGRNTAGGAITLTSGRPTEELTASGKFELGNKNLFGARAVISGPTGIEGLGYRLAAGHWERDGYEDRISGGTFGDQNRNAVKGQLYYEPNEQFDVLLIGSAEKSEEFPKTQINFTGPFATTTRGSRKTDTTDEFYRRGDNDTYTGTAIIHYLPTDNAKLTSVTGYYSNEYFLWFDEDGTPDNIAGGLEGLQSDPISKDQFSQELRFETRLWDAADLNLGFYYYDFKRTNYGSFILGSFVAPIFADDPAVGRIEIPDTSVTKTTAYAGFGQIEFNLNENLRLTLGGRINHEKKEFAAASGIALYGTEGELFFAFPPGPRESLENFEDTVFTGMASLAYAWNEDVMTYFTFSQGYKAGGFNPDAITNPAITPTYDPEEMDSYEIGAKSTLLDGRARVNLAAFWLDYTGLQVEEFVGFDQQVGNAGRSRSRGIELEVSALATDNLRIDFGLGYLDAVYRKFIGIDPFGEVVFDRGGNDLPFAPDLSTSLSGVYTINTDAGWKLDLQGEWIYSSSYYLNNDNTPASKQDAFSLFNARVSLTPASQKWEVALWARNITDEDVRADFSDDLPPFFGGTQFEVLEPPRTYGVELSIRY